MFCASHPTCTLPFVPTATLALVWFSVQLNPKTVVGADHVTPASVDFVDTTAFSVTPPPQVTKSLSV